MRRFLRRLLGLPLLRKELVEQAARKRTYIARAAYAVGLFLSFCVLFYSETSRAGSDPAQMLGKGKEMFGILINIQFAGIFIFLPAMMSGALTYEKERESMALLLMTDLRPWEILAQKYIGRLIPMFSILLLSLPLLSITYAFGGISADYLCSGIYLLVIACLCVGATSLVCSAGSRTTVAAFITSYLLVPLSLPILGLWDGAAKSTFHGVVLWSTFFIFFMLIFLVISRLLLVRHAFPHKTNRMRRVFKQIDNFMNRANRFAWGIVLIKDKTTLPTDDPVAWREVTKKSLGKARFLIRISLALGVPILLIASFLASDHAGPQYQMQKISVMLFMLWALAVIAVCVQSASAISSERARRTLDVLLTTPIEGREIIRQKMKGIWRLILAFAFPFLSIFLIQAWWRYENGDPFLSVPRYHHLPILTYLLGSILTFIIYLPMFSWASLWIGLRSKTRFRAITGALGWIIAWNLLPVFILFILEVVVRIKPMWMTDYLSLLSPAVIVPSIEFSQSPFRGELFPFIIANFLWHGGVLFYFRWLCLRKADRYLGRFQESRFRLTSDILNGIQESR